MKKKTIILTCGGTGGHIFPAISIAKAFSEYRDYEIIFVGAKGKMEMKIVPEAGFSIYGLPVRGLQRRLTFKNVILPFVLIYSLFRAVFILLKHKPVAVIGTGGYASLPTLWMGALLGFKTYIQEQNSFPGMANKWLAKRAKRVFTAYPQARDFFPPEKVEMLGNPVRFKKLPQVTDEEDFTLLILGGSLGAKRINQIMDKNLDKILSMFPELKIVWQSGKLYYEQYKHLDSQRVRVLPFVQNMAQVYAKSDLIVSRAGAATISELCVVGKACLLIPSPNVTANHQLKNAQALVQEKATQLLEEKDLERDFIKVLGNLLSDQQWRNELAKTIAGLAKPDATERIVEQIRKDL